jgi:NADH:ubiquinone oxidoreductase subunit 6 (subunit J)
MAFFLNRWGLRQDQAKNPEEAAKMLGDATAFSGPTMVFYVFVVSFAAIDWVMTLDPHWFSTIWGFLFAAGWALSFFCFAVAIWAALSDKPPMNRILGKRHFHDVGKLMLALVMVWAYFNFSQFLIIWSGNLPEETRWYLTRMEGVWGAIGVALIFFHFAFPFLVLLNREVKRNSKWLAVLAGFILLLRLVDMFYLIGPSPRTTAGHEAGFHISWMDFVAPVAVGGVWLWYFFGELLKRPLVPINDPFLENAIEHGKGH